MLKCIQEDAGEVDYDGNLPDEIAENFLNVCDFLRNVLPQEKFDEVEKVRSYFGRDDAVFEELLGYVKEKMTGYYRMTAIRKLETTSPDKVLFALEQILENFVFRYHPEFCRRNYKELGFAELQDLYDVAITLDSLVTFMVKRNYTKEAIKDAFAAITHLSDTTCKYLADEIDQNFEQQRMVVILNQLEKK